MSTETNKAIARRFYEEVFNHRNLSVLNELLADQFVNHDPAPVAPQDYDSFKHLIKTLTVAFPDHHHAIEDLDAKGDKVFMWCTFTGTHQGVFPGFLDLLPTGRFVSQKQVHTLRVQDGKLTEQWVEKDDRALKQQIGVIP